MLKDYLDVFAMALMCKEGEPCGVCRDCKLISSGSHTDVMVYPKGKKIVVSDVDDLVEKSFFKPLEGDKKVFVLNGVCSMTVQAQNKLLKTLEEPPANTYILMGATSVYPLLSTVLSRSKRLEIPPFSNENLKSFLISQGYDGDKLDSALTVSGGRLGEVIKRYQEADAQLEMSLARSVLLNLKTSKQVAEFSAKIEKANLNDFVSCLAEFTRQCIVAGTGGCATDNSAKKVLNEISVGALIYISDKIRDAEKKLYFNGNRVAVIDGLLFGVLEGKFKWSK
jgi:DNA polymerase-3 subunit delta'